jgi:hypothetical protein
MNSGMMVYRAAKNLRLFRLLFRACFEAGLIFRSSMLFYNLSTS